MNIEKLKEAIRNVRDDFTDDVFTDDVTVMEYFGLEPLVALAESVLQVEGLPEKEDCEDCGCAACSEGLGGCKTESNNQIIDECTLAVAKHYVRKSSLPSAVDIEKILEKHEERTSFEDDIGGGSFTGVSEERYGVVSEAIRKLITGE